MSAVEQDVVVGEQVDSGVIDMLQKINDYNARHGITAGNGMRVTDPINPSGIVPKGWRVLVRPKQTEEKTAGGIVLPKTTVDMEQLAQIDGTVVAIGEDCWADPQRFSGAWAKVGDTVMFGKYKGLTRTGKDGVVYRVISDTDIVCVLD